MYWEVIENHLQGVYKACNIYPRPSLMGQTQGSDFVFLVIFHLLLF